MTAHRTRARTRPLVATHRFRAVWPVTDPSVPYAVLIEGARADLPDVALRHGVKVIRAAHAAVVDGRRVPGSGGAQYVVVIEASVVRLRDLPETTTRTAKARAV